MHKPLSVLLLVLFACLASSLEYTGSNTPASMLEKMFSMIDAPAAKKSFEDLNGQVPDIIEMLAQVQGSGDAKTAASTLLTKGGDMLKAIEGSRSSAPAKKASSSSSAPTRAQTAMGMIEKVTNAALNAASQTIADTDSDSATSSPAVEDKATRAARIQKLVDKYVAEEKGKLKAAAVKKSDTPVINTQCAKGECCNVKTGSYMPAGTTCYSSPCSAPSTCLGLSSHCPPTTTFIEDNSVCPGGLCFSGVCVKQTNKQTNKQTSSTSSTTTNKQTNEKKTRDSLTKPSVTPNDEENKQTNKKFWQFDHKIKCSSGGCCDLKTNFVKVAGTKCSESKHECYEDSIDFCNGYENKCPRKAKENGTVCSIGKCYDGVCKSTSTSSTTTTTTTTTTKTSSSTSSESKIDFVDNENAVRNDELDTNLRNLEDKIAEVRQQQNKINSHAKENKKLAARNLLRDAVDKMYSTTKREHELARRALYPHQITTTKQEANDHSGNDFNVHNYITQLLVEQNKYKTESLRNATSQLQSANAKNSFSWQLIVVAAIAVVAIAVVVAIVKVGKGNKGSSKKAKDDDYETF